VALVIRKVQDLLDDDAIEWLGREAPGWLLEVESDGNLTMSPCHSRGGAREVEAATQLRDYAKINGDASWISPDHIVSLSPQERTKF